MKIDITKTIIAFNLSVISAILVYKFSNISTKILLAIIAFVFIFIPLFFAIAYKPKQQEKTKKIKGISYLFLMMIIISNVIFAIFAFENLIYIIINSFILLAFIAFLYGTVNDKEKIKQK